MTSEIDRVKSTSPQQTTRRDFVKKWAEGMIAVRFEATFLGEMTPNNKEDATQAALSVGVVPEIDPTATQEAVITGGHTLTVLRGSFIDFIPANSPPKNMVQRLNRSNLHIADARNKRPLNEASKTVTIANQEGSETSDRTIVLTVFSEDKIPEDSIKSWFNQRQEIKRAA